MSVVFLIDRREAIPVRAIPYVTGWSMSPDAVASWLAHTEAEGFQRIFGSAYHLLSDGKFSPMLAKEWDGIEADLKILSAGLHANEKFERESYPAWRLESIPLLPAGVFVWKDEFEQAFLDGNSRYNRTIVDERPGDRDLNFLPFIPLSLREPVIAGFIFSEMKVNQAKEKFLVPRKESAYLNTIAVLLELIQTPKTDRLSAADVIQEMVKNYSDAYGISISQLEKTFAAAKRNLGAN